MRLFLCAMLARKPVVSQAIVTGLNGQRFFDLYVPELGLELRIQSEDIQPAPILTDWNKDARCVFNPFTSSCDLSSSQTAQLHMCMSRHAAGLCVNKCNMNADVLFAEPLTSACQETQRRHHLTCHSQTRS